METELFSRSVAAEWLAQRLPEKTPEQWALWLRNNANTARRAVYRVPVETLGRGSFYLPEELKKFVEFEKSRQLGAIKLTGRAAEMLQAFGTGTRHGTTHGRRWCGGTVNLAKSDEAVFVQTIISEPLTVFAMTAEQATEFGRELIEAGEAAARINRQAQVNNQK